MWELRLVMSYERRVVSLSRGEILREGKIGRKAGGGEKDAERGNEKGGFFGEKSTLFMKA